jgi:hypothetical protein
MLDRSRGARSQHMGQSTGSRNWCWSCRKLWQWLFLSICLVLYWFGLSMKKTFVIWTADVQIIQTACNIFSSDNFLSRFHG